LYGTFGSAEFGRVERTSFGKKKSESVVSSEFDVLSVVPEVSDLGGPSSDTEGTSEGDEKERRLRWDVGSREDERRFRFES
jgi:hypothetical protein